MLPDPYRKEEVMVGIQTWFIIIESIIETTEGDTNYLPSRPACLMRLACLHISRPNGSNRCQGLTRDLKSLTCWLPEHLASTWQNV